jgi:hypothetical protein
MQAIDKFTTIKRGEKSKRPAAEQPVAVPRSKRQKQWDELHPAEVVGSLDD